MRKKRIPGKTTNTDLALAVHEVLDLPLPRTGYPSQSAKIVRIIIEAMKKALQSGETIHIRGFGKFYTHKPRERYSISKPIVYNTPGQYNPTGTVQSDAQQWFPGRRKVYFQPSVQLTAMLNIDNPTAHERTRAMNTW